MATVRDLISQLQNFHDLDEPILFQYMTAVHTSMPEDRFAEVAEYLMDDAFFSESSVNCFYDALREADDALGGSDA